MEWTHPLYTYPRIGHDGLRNDQIPPDLQVYGVFRPSPQRGIAQGLDGDMSLGVAEIAQRLNQPTSLKFLLFAL